MDAFGFFDSEDENEAVLLEAARVLAPTGRLVLKVVNGGLVLDAFRQTEREEREGAVVEIANTLTFDPPRLTQRVSVRGGRGRREYERRQRLYRIEEMRGLLEHAGFAVVDVLGNPQGAEFEPVTSSAMWIVARQRGAV
jgi:hypothetical protein